LFLSVYERINDEMVLDGDVVERGQFFRIINC